MDTSEEYIEMCREAPEIQDKWSQSKGDWAYIEEVNAVRTLCSAWWYKMESFITQQIGDEDERLDEFDDIVWLPRQDQLQKMVDDKYSHRSKAANDVSGVLEYLVDQSYEKAWLIITMYMLYNKKWDGNNWVDAKEYDANHTDEMEYWGVFE